MNATGSYIPSIWKKCIEYILGQFSGRKYGKMYHSICREENIFQTDVHMLRIQILHCIYLIRSIETIRTTEALPWVSFSNKPNSRYMWILVDIIISGFRKLLCRKETQKARTNVSVWIQNICVSEHGTKPGNWSLSNHLPLLSEYNTSIAFGWNWTSLLSS